MVKLFLVAHKKRMTGMMISVSTNLGWWRHARLLRPPIAETQTIPLGSVAATIKIGLSLFQFHGQPKH